MAFTEEQKQGLLAQKGIGKTVVARLEAMGFDDIEKLAHADVQDVLALGAQMTHSTCWKNSPQARKAIEAAVLWAKTQLP
ncbi:MAG: recombinase RecA [Neisseria sp.]|uniref:recombinase RecA n=1 Tax=Neisseria sp. TaxID=192066 RepID=UPI0026DC7140|nr:recombinase RecA [Neisseria sp.]MDO4640374.1 recombinase RecA [Neisseria sp.]